MSISTLGTGSASLGVSSNRTGVDELSLEGLQHWSCDYFPCLTKDSIGVLLISFHVKDNRGQLELSQKAVKGCQVGSLQAGWFLPSIFEICWSENCRFPACKVDPRRWVLERKSNSVCRSEAG